jgi:hypothetical protein
VPLLISQAVPSLPEVGHCQAQVYKAMRRHVQECAVKILRNVNEDELTNFQRVSFVTYSSLQAHTHLPVPCHNACDLCALLTTA